MANMGLKDEVKEELGDLDKRMEIERKKLDGSRLGLVDLVTEKFVSRKLLVWVTATAMLYTGHITPDEWTAITLGYVGIEGMADLAVKWRTAGKKE
jgi:hypothetical protein